MTKEEFNKIMRALANINNQLEQIQIDIKQLRSEDSKVSDDKKWIVDSQNEKHSSDNYNAQSKPYVTNCPGGTTTRAQERNWLHEEVMAKRSRKYHTSVAVYMDSEGFLIDKPRYKKVVTHK